MGGGRASATASSRVSSNSNVEDLRQQELDQLLEEHPDLAIAFAQSKTGTELKSSEIPGLIVWTGGGSEWKAQDTLEEIEEHYRTNPEFRKTVDKAIKEYGSYNYTLVPLEFPRVSVGLAHGNEALLDPFVGVSSDGIAAPLAVNRVNGGVSNAEVKIARNSV